MQWDVWLYSKEKGGHEPLGTVEADHAPGARLAAFDKFDIHDQQRQWNVFVTLHGDEQDRKRVMFI